MKRAFLDLSKGLNLTPSDLSVPFKVTRLPLIPNPGANWSSHPGHDVISTHAPLEGVSKFAYADASGVLVYENGGKTWVANPFRGLYKAGSFRVKDGAFITGLGLYRGRNANEYIFLDEPAPPVLIKPPEVISGSLEAGAYAIWVLSFSRTPSGLFLTWYSYTELSLQANKGVRITLAEEPGPNRVVNIYVQRGGSQLIFLKSLSRAESSFDYISHLQEGEVVELAIPEGTGGLGAYYNGRHFYQASSIRVLGAKQKEKAPSIRVLGAKQKEKAPLTPFEPPPTPPSEPPPTPPAPPSVYGYATPGGVRGFGNITPNSAPATYTHAIEWKAAVRTDKGYFVALVDGYKLRILHSDAPDLLGWSLVVEYTGLPAPQCAAASPSKVVFLGGGKAIVGDLSDPFNPFAWSVYDTPGTDTPGIVWSGTEFGASVNAPVRGLMTSSDGINWALRAAEMGREVEGYTFHDIIYAGGPYIIQGRKNLGDGFYVDYFSYSGGGWTKLVREEDTVSFGFIRGVVRRRYTAMFTIRYGSTDYVVVSYGIKGGSYGISDGDGWTDLPESDYHAVYTLNGFLGNQRPVAFYYSTPVHTTASPYERLWLIGDYATMYFRYNGKIQRYVFNPEASWKRIQQDAPGVVGAVSDGSSIVEVGPSWTKREVWTKGGMSATYYYELSTNSFAAHTDGSTIVWVSQDNLYITTNAFRTLRYQLPRYSDHFPQIAVGKNHYLLTDYSPITSVGSRLYLIPKSNPSEFHFLDEYIGSARIIPLGIIGEFAYAYCGGQYKRYPIAGGNTVAYSIASDFPSVATDGTNVFVSGGNKVYKLDGGTATPVYTASGTINSLFSGNGKIYFSIRRDVYELETATFTATLKFTIPTGDYAGPGAELPDGIVVVGVEKNSGYHTGIYLFSGTTLSTVYEASGRFLIPFSRTTPSTSTTYEASEHFFILSGDSGSGGSDSGSGDSGGDNSGGGGSGGDSSGGGGLFFENPVTKTNFQPNTVVWTYPGYVNLTSPYYWYTFTSRSSRTINEIIPSPSGVLVFMDNDTFVMSGRFTSASDTRVSPFPVQVGVDAGTRVSQAGSTLFIIWGGQVYALGDGLELVSYPVDDGVRFVGVAYAPKENTLYALKSDGRVLGYYLPRGAWYNEADGVQDIAQYYDGTNSIVALLKGGSLYKRFEGGLPSPKYSMPDPIIVLEAVKVDDTDIKRLRGVFIEAKLEGPANPVLTLVNESGTITSHSFTETLASSSFGLARYRAIFPPVFFRALSRMEIGFSGYRLSLGDKVELRYEGVSRRA